MVIQVLGELNFDNLFCEFGYVRKIGDRPVVGEGFFVKVGFLQQWFDDGVFEIVWERAR